jgi:hypothetical protein
LITIFNRKELLTTQSIQRQAEVRQILSQHDMEYLIKTINRRSPSPFWSGTRAYTGSFGENPLLEYEYIIYVKKEEFDQAGYLINKR